MAGQPHGKADPVIEIPVTHEDIESGERNSCYLCPVARAIQRHFPDQVTVYASSLIIGRENYRVLDSLKRFISAFDKGSTVEPFTLILDGHYADRIL